MLRLCHFSADTRQTPSYQPWAFRHTCHWQEGQSWPAVQPNVSIFLLPCTRSNLIYPRTIMLCGKISVLLPSATGFTLLWAFEMKDVPLSILYINSPRGMGEPFPDPQSRWAAAFACSGLLSISTASSCTKCLRILAPNVQGGCCALIY